MKKENILAIKFPELAKEWHPTKNENLTPNDVTYSSRKEIWWLCEHGHEWKTILHSRTNHPKRNGKEWYGCPACTGQIPSQENNLQVKYPKIAKQWHPTKNDKLTPLDVTPSSRKKVWWVCDRGHEWIGTVDNAIRLKGCPHCNKEKRTSFPEQFIYYYIKQIFIDSINSYKPNFLNRKEIDIFIPSLNLGIEYDGYNFHKSKSQISNDKVKNNICKNNNIFLIRIRENGLEEFSDDNLYSINCNPDKEYNYLLQVINEIVDFINKKFYTNICLNINLERDKENIYSSFLEREKEKSLLSKHPQLCNEWNFDKNKGLTPDMFTCSSHKKVWWICKKGHEWETYIYSRVNSGYGCPVCSGKKVHIDNCLATVNPNLASQWHPTKNGDLTPYNVTRGSRKKVWWICEKGHEWLAVVDKRSKGTKCPICNSNKGSFK